MLHFLSWIYKTISWRPKSTHLHKQIQYFRLEFFIFSATPSSPGNLFCVYLPQSISFFILKAAFGPFWMWTGCFCIHGNSYYNFPICSCWLVVGWQRVSLINGGEMNATVCRCLEFSFRHFCTKVENWTFPLEPGIASRSYQPTNKEQRQEPRCWPVIGYVEFSSNHTDIRQQYSSWGSCAIFESLRYSNVCFCWRWGLVTRGQSLLL